jgi:SAM-dependent methyltransferase
VRMTSGSRTYRDIDGWFSWTDHAMFRGILEAQRTSPGGDLVEIGAFKGKSAVVIGDYLRPEEQFVVVDTFGDPDLLGIADESSERTQGRNYFTSLSRSQFEKNYLSIHDALPTVVQALSTDVVNHVTSGAARFIHVDGSHQYEDVADDCRSVKKLLRSDGVVVFDDWRKPACPGVAAAIWDSALHDGLIPVALTPQKLYGVHGDPEPLTAAVRALVAAHPQALRIKEIDLFGRTVLLVTKTKRRRKPAPASTQHLRTGSVAAGSRSGQLRRTLTHNPATSAVARWVRSRRS